MKTVFLFLILLILLPLIYFQLKQDSAGASMQKEIAYWFILHRKSNKEYLYFGEAGKKENSALVKVFNVKTGIPGERPTPLPKLMGKDYWLIVGKHEEAENPETAPYFLTLNIPVSPDAPFGPEPYLECNGQCNWILPGAFGLHGNNGDPEKLADSNPGSSGCIRHSAQDISYIYNIVDPQNSQVRYYIDDI